MGEPLQQLRRDLEAAILDQQLARNVAEEEARRTIWPRVCYSMGFIFAGDRGLRYSEHWKEKACRGELRGVLRVDRLILSEFALRVYLENRGDCVESVPAAPDRKAQAGWCAGILDPISTELRTAFPEMKGFLRTNLKYVRAFAEAWRDLKAIGQQPVDQLPWRHNVILATKLKTREARQAPQHSGFTHRQPNPGAPGVVRFGQGELEGHWCGGRLQSSPWKPVELKSKLRRRSPCPL